LFDLPRQRAGIYMVNAYSGNLWFGTNSIDPGRSQAFLISQIDPNHQWTDALVTNLIIGAVDLASCAAGDLKTVDHDAFNEIIKTLAADVTKTVTSYQATYGEIDRNGALE